MIKSRLFLRHNPKYSLPVAIVIAGILALGGIYLVFKSHAATNNADFNNDGIVNITDLSILATHWNQAGLTQAQGDANGDGAVNITDLSILATQWGTNPGGGTAVDPCASFNTTTTGFVCPANVGARTHVSTSTTPFLDAGTTVTYTAGVNVAANNGTSCTLCPSGVSYSSTLGYNITSCGVTVDSWEFDSPLLIKAGNHTHDNTLDEQHAKTAACVRLTHDYFTGPNSSGAQNISMCGGVNSMSYDYSGPGSTHCFVSGLTATLGPGPNQLTGVPGTFSSIGVGDSLAGSGNFSTGSTHTGYTAASTVVDQVAPDGSSITLLSPWAGTLGALGTYNFNEFGGPLFMADDTLIDPPIACGLPTTPCGNAPFGHANINAWRIYAHGIAGGDCGWFCSIHDSYFASDVPPTTGGTHGNGFSQDESMCLATPCTHPEVETGLTLIHSTFLCSQPGTNGAICDRPFDYRGDFGYITGGNAVNNLFKWTPQIAYCISTGNNNADPQASNMTWVNNVFERGPNGGAGCGVYDYTQAPSKPTVDWNATNQCWSASNHWDDGTTVGLPTPVGSC